MARAGVLDTDSVEMRGVAPRLVLSTILPKDEESLFHPSEECFDLAETGALRVTSYAFLVFLSFLF